MPMPSPPKDNKCYHDDSFPSIGRRKTQRSLHLGSSGGEDGEVVLEILPASWICTRGLSLGLRVCLALECY